MAKRIVGVLVLVILVASTAAEKRDETGVVMGTVAYAPSKHPMHRAFIFLVAHTRMNALSDENGGFEITNVPVGNYIVKATYTLCEPDTVAATVAANETTFVALEFDYCGCRVEPIVR